MSVLVCLFARHEEAVGARGEEQVPDRVDAAHGEGRAEQLRAHEVVWFGLVFKKKTHNTAAQVSR